MTHLTHKFVEFIPEKLEDNVLYVSIAYRTVSHNCCCGCGREVVTPLNPTDWKLTFDGETVSLYPSIGNWKYPCRSHYWIRNDRVEWSGNWTDEQVDRAITHDRLEKEKHYANKEPAKVSEKEQVKAPEPRGFLARLVKRFFHRG